MSQFYTQGDTRGEPPTALWAGSGPLIPHGVNVIRPASLKVPIGRNAESSPMTRYWYVPGGTVAGRTR